MSTVVPGLIERKARVFRRDVWRVASSLPAWLRYRASGRLPEPAALEIGGLSRRDLQLYVDPWYHDFGALGVPTPQGDDHFPGNQRSKEPVLTSMLDEAMQRARPDAPSLLELFCADGYFGCMAAQKGAGSVVGIDLNPYHLERARLAARMLGLDDRVRFERRNVFAVDGRYDVIMNCGGLYHIDNPWELLRRNRTLEPDVLLVQTVYSLARSEPDYFETPTPGWTWGCRFSLAFFEDMLRRAGWRIERMETNELEGNTRPEDRGSVYAVCVPGE